MLKRTYSCKYVKRIIYIARNLSDKVNHEKMIWCYVYEVYKWQQQKNTNHQHWYTYQYGVAANNWQPIRVRAALGSLCQLASAGTYPAYLRQFSLQKTQHINIQDCWDWFKLAYDNMLMDLMVVLLLLLVDLVNALLRWIVLRHLVRTAAFLHHFRGVHGLLGG